MRDLLKLIRRNLIQSECFTKAIEEFFQEKQKIMNVIDKFTLKIFKSRQEETLLNAVEHRKYMEKIA